MAISPFERPDARLVVALTRTEATAILDLGRNEEAANRALTEVAEKAATPFGVRVPTGVRCDLATLPSKVDLLVLDADSSHLQQIRAFQSPVRRVLVQVTTTQEARQAIALGAHGLIAKGCEAGGRVGEETSFVLLQRLKRDLGDTVPIWVQGGVGIHTAAACVAGGAKGFVLDAQLALARESTLPVKLRTAIRSMDGSETAVFSGYRVFTRPDLKFGSIASTSASATEVRQRLGGDDLDAQLLPAGQDAAFAKLLADRFRTASGIVHGLREAAWDHLQLAALHRPLAPDAPLARDHQVRFPIVQGPMTRVSDRAEFADAVSAAGALPFLALSLLRGPAVRALLQETKALLGTRPFGVGILGFVPDDIRDEQMSALHELPPAAAIIAGGRPSRARPLEEKGTATYLHVPSPGLLDLFLKDGARRFVFEGRECGGHVGPRTSFVLWEQQIERLLSFEKPEELSVLFAGGIHDARSAAMVSAMSAALTARGARVGVLLGTAYLFTEEAVTSGAIVRGFQKAALACGATALLETAPGHATRCVDSQYVQSFRSQRTQLESEGHPRDEVWARLEQLNLGRLRLAAKGQKREGGELVTVGEAEQASEGMFMIGQLASLRDEVTTMAALHHDVSIGSLEILEQSRPSRTDTPINPPADIAIVGISCMFPDAADRHAYWANIVAARDSVTEVPKERWNPAIYYDPKAQSGDKTPSKWGGFLPTIEFDPLSYGIPPRSLASIEPVQLLSLEVARRALEDAGYGTRSFCRERTSVIFGAEAGTELSSAYGFRAQWPQYAGELPASLDEHLPTLTEDSFPGVLANVIAGRIANRLDLGGVNYTVDAACAASLAAVDLAVKELTSHTSDMVLCGGADVHNSINDYLLFASVHALSPTGACKAFDASADGIALGEGVACVVLKRLADAERDGDRIYAVIKGVAGSSDGKSLGLTAPRKEGQMRALARAYAASGVSPRTVGLVEAHGTGTVVGDRTELSTLSEVYCAAGSEPGSVTLGSVKSQIGHTKCAAGLAGLIKVALSIYHKTLPPTLHISRFNPGYEASSSPFVFSKVARPWPQQQRRGALSAFGFGGTNFHAVVESYDGVDGPESGLTAWPYELFLFRASTREAALQQVDQLEKWLDDPSLRLADLARSVSEAFAGDKGRDGTTQIAIIAKSKADLKERLAAARLGSPQPRALFFADAKFGAGKLAFLFPGQGSQRIGMLADAFIAFPDLQELLASGAPWCAAMFPPLATGDEARAAQMANLTDTRVAQPALGIANMAMAKLLTNVGIQADVVGGHSYGELTALCYAGAIEFDNLLSLSRVRGESIVRATAESPGGMAAVSASAHHVEPLLRNFPGVVVANINAPDQTVISGPSAGLDEAVKYLASQSLSVQTFPVACAFHSPSVASASLLLARFLQDIPISPSRLPVFSNATASPYPSEPDEIRRMIASHVALPVRFADQIEAMYQAGVRVFVEVGPARVLTGLVAKVLKGRQHLAVACDQASEPPLRPLLVALAQLATSGVSIDATALFAGREARKVDLTAAQPHAVSPSSWLVNGHLARPAHGELPKGALRPAPDQIVAISSTSPAQALPPTGREAAVFEFLRSTREVIEAQRQVLLEYFGDGQRSEAEAIHGLPSFSPPTISPPAVSHPALSLPTAGPPPSIPPVSKPPQETLDWMRELGAPTQRSIPAPAPAVVDMQATLLRIVSERTGYPVEMLDLDLNLEAELSIDSIKRIEILATLSNEVGLGSGQGQGQHDAQMEQLATRKTLRAILSWLQEQSTSTAQGNGMAHAQHHKANGESSSVPTQAVTEHASIGNGTPASSSPLLKRFVLRTTDAPLRRDEATSFTGQTWTIVPDRAGLAQALAAALSARGATCVFFGDAVAPRRVDGFLDLSILSEETDGSSIEKRFFERVRVAIAAGARHVLAACKISSPFVAQGSQPLPGIAGLLKSLTKERQVVTRSVALDFGASISTLVAQLIDEAACGFGPVEVAYVNGTRQTLAAVATPLLTPEPSSQQGYVARPFSRAPLTRDSVVVATGGARGITAQLTHALARKFGCQIELIGRSPLPTADEPAYLAGATSVVEIRRALIARTQQNGHSIDPKALERTVAQLVRDREIRDTLTGISKLGCNVHYQSVDVCDAGSLGAAIDSIYARRGRIDMVLHGAGLVEDRFLDQKTPESFARVFDTKVVAARTLLNRLRSNVDYLVFLSSVVGAFGNKGQIDYAAANDALDKLSWWHSRKSTGRVLAINWGPWSGGGMVSEELAREYARRGIGLLDREQAAEAFVDELMLGSDPQVVLMNAPLEAFASTASERHKSPRSESEPEVLRALDA